MIGTGLAHRPYTPKNCLAMLFIPHRPTLWCRWEDVGSGLGGRIRALLVIEREVELWCVGY